MSICIDFEPSDDAPHSPFVIRVFGSDQVIERTDVNGIVEFGQHVAREVARARKENRDALMRAAFSQ